MYIYIYICSWVVTYTDDFLHRWDHPPSSDFCKSKGSSVRKSKDCAAHWPKKFDFHVQNMWPSCTRKMLAGQVDGREVVKTQRKLLVTGMWLAIYKYDHIYIYSTYVFKDTYRLLYTLSIHVLYCILFIFAICINIYMCICVYIYITLYHM